MKKRSLLSLVVLAIGVSDYITAQTTYVYFDYAKDALTAAAEKTLDSLLRTLPQAKDRYTVQLVGHTDSDGDKAYNEALSLRRCEAVRIYLCGQGFGTQQIQSEGRYYRDSLGTNTNERGKARNRRVEVLFSEHTTTPLPPVVPLGAGLPVQTLVFDNKAGATLQYKSGTVVRIPAGVLAYPDGKPVEGAVELQYYEMRDAADFIASGIPMVYKDQIFNSAGMFEITVSQNGVPLQVLPGKYYNIEFAKTDNLPDLGFYRYNRATNEWTTLGRLADNAESFATNSDAPCFEPKRSVRITATDTVNTFMNAMRLGLEMSKTQGLIQEYAAGRFLSLEERWKSADYAGTALLLNGNNKRRDWRKAEMAVETRADLSDSKLQYTDTTRQKVVALNHTYLDISIGNPDYVELSALKKYKWVYLKKGEVYALADLKADWADGYMVKDVPDKKGQNNRPDSVRYDIVNEAGYLFTQIRRWTDVRLEYKGQGAFELFVKGNKHHPMTIYPEIGGRVAGNEKQAQKIWDQYQEALAKRQTAFDQTIALHRAHWDYFMDYSKPYRAGNEPCMSDRNWIQYFDNKHGEVMTPRYERLLNTPPQGDSILLSLQTGILPPPPPNPSDTLTQSLNLDGFGVFNCDQLMRLGNTIEVLAHYTTKEGNTVAASMLYMIDDKYNTALTFAPPNRFSFNPQSRTTLFVRGKDGRSYVVRPATIKAAQMEEGQLYTLLAEDVTASTGTTEGLRAALRGETK